MTERDLVRHNESKLKTAICELVDGTLVEKAMGWNESEIAALIVYALLSIRAATEALARCWGPTACSGWFRG